MKAKHPARKRAITPLTEEELGYQRKSLDRDWFIAKLLGLKHDVAPGLGCLRNEHILALALNPNREAPPGAKAAVNNYLEYACSVVLVELPKYFYAAWVACRLVPANKVDPDELPPGTPADYRPVNIGGGQTSAHYAVVLR